MRCAIIAATFVAGVVSIPFAARGPIRDANEQDCEVVWVTASYKPPTVSPPASSSIFESMSLPSMEASSQPASSQMASSQMASSQMASSQMASSQMASSQMASSQPASSQSADSSPTKKTSQAQVPPKTTKATTAPPEATGNLPFPYPSGHTSVGDWDWSYSAPTQMTWTAPTGAFDSSAHRTSYVLSDENGVATSTTTTKESACTAVPESYKKAALDPHNEHRAKHSANPLVWDDDLACIAQRQAESCVWNHLTYVSGGGYGQNLGGGADITGSVDMWYSEAPNFDPYYGQANPGGDFGSYGHFTQMVWAYTTSLGCATFDCGSGKEGVPNSATGDLTVCNYFAGGNMGGFYGVYVLPESGAGGW
ncbi:hypothetical protein LTR37_000305 [Vermiconidia calcicola]|uniref:Uncharacterized protein n=1 Tax=Vermiconidia calcicola TaxID=1690605 RepID=A0ACC3P1K5_9PEZI|nr:hypothetical protein LTR37_000305 [Vermiconidia calcicola]